MNDHQIVRVGFIGLGTMGAPMAANVAKGGYALMVYDTDRSAVHALRPSGATVASDCAAIAEWSDVVITMLPRPGDVEAVVLGTDSTPGIVDRLRENAVFVDMSTGDPITAQRLAKALKTGGRYVVDCPVGRTQTHAQAGTLLLMAGGEDQAIDAVSPVLMCMGNELVRCGGPGMGQAMKLVNNMLSLIITQGVSEALVVGLRAGLSLDVIRGVTAKTMAQTAELDHALPAKTFKGDLTPGFALRLAEKDIRLAIALAAQLGVAVPLAEGTLRSCAALNATGYADQDVGVMVAAPAAKAGVELRIDDPS